MVSIFLSTIAQARLKEIHSYLSIYASDELAIKIVARILDKIELLKNHTEMGQVEELAKHLGKGHRYLVQGNY